LAVAAIDDITITLLISEIFMRGTRAAVIQYVPVRQGLLWCQLAKGKEWNTIDVD